MPHTLHYHYWKYVWDEPFPAWLRGESSYCDELTAHPKDRFCNFFQGHPGSTTAKIARQFFPCADGAKTCRFSRPSTEQYAITR